MVGQSGDVALSSAKAEAELMGKRSLMADLASETSVAPEMFTDSSAARAIAGVWAGPDTRRCGRFRFRTRSRARRHTLRRSRGSRTQPTHSRS